MIYWNAMCLWAAGAELSVRAVFWNFDVNLNLKAALIRLDS